LWGQLSHVALPFATLQIETHHGEQFRDGEVQAAVKESTLLEAIVIEESMEPLKVPPRVVVKVVDEGEV